MRPFNLGFLAKNGGLNMLKRMLFCFCIILLVGYSAIADGAILLDRIMAIVNKDVITWSELYKAMEFEASDEIRAMKDEERRKFFKENEMTFLDSMIDMKLQLQEAGRYGVFAKDEDINRAIDGIKKKYSMTNDMFEEAINREGYTKEEYRKKLAEQIALSRIVDHEVKSKVVVTEKEIDAYMSDNKEIEKDKEGFDISHIFIKRTGDEKQTEAVAGDIYERIKAGEDFSELARRHSQDPSARTGGHMGFIKKIDLSKDFLNMLLKIKKGEITEPFWSSNGIHILRLNDVRLFQSREELRESVRQKLLDEKVEKQYKNWMRGLRDRAYIEIKL